MASRYALISVTNKDGVALFAKFLQSKGYSILSTGGTSLHLTQHGVSVVDVATLTGSPEILDGRVKTLHPKIHGGILTDRDNAAHREQSVAHDLPAIDLVVVNLYDFKGKVLDQHLPAEKAIEFIDIGGPTMLRAAAKNHQHCTPVCDPGDYMMVMEEIESLGKLRPSTKAALAAKTFSYTSSYDGMIADFLNHSVHQELFLPLETLMLQKISSLRYGENPQQKASLYRCTKIAGPWDLTQVEILQGKELSYNNYLDLSSAASLILEFGDQCCAVIVKHNNPCGVASSQQKQDLFARAFSCDPQSSFGGVVATNVDVDLAFAQQAEGVFLECFIAPEFSAEARQIFAAKKNLRLIRAPWLAASRNHQTRFRSSWDLRPILGGLLVQEEDDAVTAPAVWTRASAQTASEEQLADLWFAMRVAKWVKSNAIVLAKGQKTLGIGAGQMSRVDSLRAALMKAKQQGFSLEGSVMASDGFFPFRDSVDLAFAEGVRAVVHPGGSIRDAEVVQAADEQGMALYVTGKRHFKH